MIFATKKKIIKNTLIIKLLLKWSLTILCCLLFSHTPKLCLNRLCWLLLLYNPTKKYKKNPPSYVVTNERLAKKKGITIIYGKVFYPVPLCSQICKFFVFQIDDCVCVCVC